MAMLFHLQTLGSERTHLVWCIRCRFSDFLEFPTLASDRRWVFMEGEGGTGRWMLLMELVPKDTAEITDETRLL